MLPLMYIGLHVKNPLFMSEFNKNVSTDFRKILKYQISWKCVQWESSCSTSTDRWMDEWTDMMKPTAVFFKISRKRLKSGPYRPYSQKSETHWKQGVTLVGRRQGKDNYKSHIFFVGATTQLGPKTPHFEVSRSHTNTHTHTRQDSFGWVISSLQRPLPTQHTRYTTTNIHVLSGIRTRGPSY